MKHFKVILSLAVLSGLLLVNFSCSNSTEPDGEILAPESVSLTENLPDSLSNDVTVQVAMLEFGYDIGYEFCMSAWTNYEQTGKKEYSATEGDLTITFSASFEEKGGVEGTTWSLTYDGLMDTVSFNNKEVFRGWTANEGGSGEFVIYSESLGQPGTVSTYAWDTSLENVLTVTYEVAHLEDQSEVIEGRTTYTVHPDGSGTYAYDDLQDDQYDYQMAWDAQGNLVQ